MGWKDKLPDGDRSAGSGDGVQSRERLLLSAGDNRGIEPTRVLGVTGHSGAVNGLLFPAQDTRCSDRRCSVTVALGESAPQIWGRRGEGRQEKGPVTLVLSAPHPQQKETERLSVTQPEARPGLGTVWPLSPGQRAIWVCPVQLVPGKEKCGAGVPPSRVSWGRSQRRPL